MQYLEGETLAARLTRGPLPLDQALECAIQIADALDKAHGQGIVHRDLKPGNIFLCSRGPTPARARHTAFGGGASRGRYADEHVSAKLLDFGLAKTTAPVLASAALSELPTTPPELTAEGTLLGTFQYMAPEQLEGNDADARTDLFAFGAVVYEMVTGKRAFEGKSQASLMSAIMKDEPRPMSALQPLTPPTLDRIVKRCLAKEPERRWQSANDLCDELKWVAETAPEATASTAAALPAKRVSGRMARVLTAVATVATAAAVALGILYLRGAPATGARPIRLSVTPPQNVTFSTVGGQTVPAVSPDGHRVAFVANRAGTNLLWVRSLDALEAQSLPGTEGGSNLPFWSPDSRTIGFFQGGALKTIDASGGPVRTLCNVPGPGAIGISGGTWNSEGVILFGSGNRGGLFKVSASGGAPTPLTRPDTAQGETAHRSPAFLADGWRFLYVSVPSNTVWLGSLDGSTPMRLLAADSQATYVAPGYILFVRQGTLMAQPFDARRAALAGEELPIAERVLSGGGFPLSSFAASSNGVVLAYRSGTPGVPTELTWVDRAGRPIGVVGQSGLYRNPELSPDGTRVAIEAIDPQARTLDIWLVELARQVTSRFTFDRADDLFPVWAPDASSIIFGSNREGGVQNLYQKRADGVGGENRVLKSSADMVPLSWALDGRFLLYASIPIGFGILPFAGERTPRPFEPAPPTFTQAYGQVSPDGRWLAYTSTESGRPEIYVQSFPSPGGGKWQVSKDGGVYSRWRRDSREIFYYANDGRLMAVPIAADGALKIGAAIPLFNARLLNGPAVVFGFRQQFDVARDGQRFLLNVPLGEDASASSITVVTNWAVGLKK